MPRLTSSWLDRKQTPGVHRGWQHSTLGVRVWADGQRKSFYWQRGSGKRVTLGQWPAMGVADAIARAAELDANGASAPKAARTIRDLHVLWARDLVQRKGDRGTQEVRWAQLRKHAGHLLDTPATEISKDDLVALRTDLAQRSVHVARDVTGHLTSLVELGTGVRYRLRELPRPKEATRRRIADIGKWWAEVRASDATPAMKDALCFAALTGLRGGEIKKLRASHVSNGWLHVPDPKFGPEWAFDRHMPTQCLALLKTEAPFAFDKIRVKGLPATQACRHHFIGVAESETGVPRRVIRSLINHQGNTDVTDGYGHVPPEEHARWSQAIADIIAEKMNL